MHVLFADSQPKVRFALRVLLEQQTGVEVVGEAADAQTLLAQAQALSPDLVLLAWGLPGMAMNDLLPAIRAIYPRMYIVVLSERQEYRQAALAAGADAFVSKANPPEQLLSIVEGCCRNLHIRFPAANEIPYHNRRMKKNEISIKSPDIA